MNNANHTINNGIRHLLIALSGAALLSLTAQAGATDPNKAVSVDDYETAEIARQLSANGARRRAYDYMESLGYMKNNTTGSARVRSVTREGDTWIARVAYSSGGRVLSQQAVLYIDAYSALVSEVPPKGIEGQVAAQ